MDTTTAPDFRALALKLLKLDESATDEQIIAAAATAEVEPRSSDKKDDDASPANVTPMAAATTPDTTALAARMDKIERDYLVAEATRQGKVIPLSAEALLLTPLAVLTDLIAQLPAGTVPLKAGAEMQAQTPALKSLSAEEAIVASRLGYTAEQFRAANPV
jgi:phage I-like protein